MFADNHYPYLHICVHLTSSLILLIFSSRSSLFSFLGKFPETIWNHHSNKLFLIKARVKHKSSWSIFIYIFTQKEHQEWDSLRKMHPIQPTIQSMPIAKLLPLHLDTNTVRRSIPEFKLSIGYLNLKCHPKEARMQYEF